MESDEGGDAGAVAVAAETVHFVGILWIELVQGPARTDTPKIPSIRLCKSNTESGEE